MKFTLVISVRCLNHFSVPFMVLSTQERILTILWSLEENENTKWRLSLLSTSCEWWYPVAKRSRDYVKPCASLLEEIKWNVFLLLHSSFVLLETSNVAVWLIITFGGSHFKCIGRNVYPPSFFDVALGVRDTGSLKYNFFTWYAFRQFSTQCLKLFAVLFRR